jgi:hypothetical protein
MSAVHLPDSDTFRNLFVVISATIAVMSILSSHRIAKRKQSADVIFAGRSDTSFQEGIRTIREIKRSDPSRFKTAALPINVEKMDAKAICYVLNYFELIGTGIDEKIYEESMFKRSYYSTAISAFDDAMPFITELRLAFDRPTLYQDLEAMISRWKRKPLKQRKRR